MFVQWFLQCFHYVEFCVPRIIISQRRSLVKEPRWEIFSRMAKLKGQNQDAWHRVAYLHQISQAIVISDQNGRSDNISRYYSSVLKQVCQRLVLRLSPDTKRSICKACSGVLIPGITSKIRIIKKYGQKVLAISCISCNYIRRYPVHKQYTPDGEQAGAEICTGDCKNEPNTVQS